MNNKIKLMRKYHKREEELYIAKITVYAINTLITFHPVKAKNKDEAKKKIFAYYKAKDLLTPDNIELNETII